ncbi:Protein phosphatase 1K, mitochondrial [Armadillidium nasatum]|uniref:Protein phosphatase 1K, mitochondrial n=1 Tax=Armadillidium nasatum TaxID=96803 RepID=A0A5N5SPM0_9CRUS|nr:Protein phosphatase 1K, mitochondrial [Armadillidium nasatum]
MQRMSVGFSSLRKFAFCTQTYLKLCNINFENQFVLKRHKSFLRRAHFRSFLLSKLKSEYNQNLKYATSSSDRKGNSSSEKEPVSIDSFGAWDSNFELPLQMEASIQHGKPIPRISASDVGCKTSQGKRTYQEDRYWVKDVNEHLLCCAVFDGHGGSECSEFCASNIENILEKNLEKSPDLESLLHNSILELNSSYSKRTGSTCTICLLKDSLNLVIGYVGDSRALLCRRGAPRRLSDDHCPSNITERRRVEQSGGRVITDNIGRHMVNGMLSMSRSIGDLHLKPYGVTALPDIRRTRIKHGNDSFILLTTDGINFVLNDEEICKVINHAPDPQTAASALTEQALAMSSEDNLTAIVIPLGSWGKFAKSASSMFYSFGIGRDLAKSSRFG